MTYLATPCGCGHRNCTAWWVSGVADVVGVRLTRRQAQAVAGLLTYLDQNDQKSQSDAEARRLISALEECASRGASGVVEARQALLGYVAALRARCAALGRETSVTPASEDTGAETCHQET